MSILSLYLWVWFCFRDGFTWVIFQIPHMSDITLRSLSLSESLHLVWGSLGLSLLLQRTSLYLYFNVSHTCPFVHCCRQMLSTIHRRDWTWWFIWFGLWFFGEMIIGIFTITFPSYQFSSKTSGVMSHGHTSWDKSWLKCDMCVVAPTHILEHSIIQMNSPSIQGEYALGCSEIV